jgi:hypothetical protein
MGDHADDIIDRMLIESMDADPAKTCKHCGEFPLFWLKEKSGWVLIDQKGKKHVCKNRKREDVFHGI